MICDWRCCLIVSKLIERRFFSAACVASRFRHLLPVTGLQDRYQVRRIIDAALAVRPIPRELTCISALSSSILPSPIRAQSKPPAGQF